MHADVLKDYEKLKASNIIKRKSEERSTVHKKIKQTTLKEASFKAVNLDNLIVDFVIETMSPLSIVESTAFAKN